MFKTCLIEVIMNRDETTAKEKILQAAMELISGGKTDRQITMRQIALKAGVNLALVNYYYQSKENLLSHVVGIIMGGLIEQTTINAETDALTKLRNMLLTTAEAAFKYRNISKIAVSAELKSGCRNSCEMVIPLLKEILPDCDMSDISIIALQLMIPFHHIVVDPEYFNNYLHTNFYNEDKMRQKINQMVDNILAGRI